MVPRSDPLDELVIPTGTTAEEHDLVTDGDVMVGGQSTVEFGVRARNLIAGERVQFGGDIEASGDCRLDMWSDVDGSVLVGTDAYLGERVHVGGQLVVGNDLDIGDDVQIDEGFEANGWIVIRNPMPTIVFLLIYLSQLLRMGEEDVAENLVAELLDEDDQDEQPLLIPRSSQVSDDVWRVSTPARIGDECRLHGNIRAKTIEIGEGTELYGSLRARGEISIGDGTTIHGDVTTRSGDVALGPDVQVRGDVSGADLDLARDAQIDGAIRASGEMRLRPDSTAEPTATDSPASDEDAATESESDADQVDRGATESPDAPRVEVESPAE